MVEATTTTNADCVLRHVGPLRSAPSDIGGNMARSTQEVLQHHLDALAAQDIEAVVSDYADDASLIAPDVTVTGTVALHDFFTEILKAMPGIIDALTIDRTENVGEIAYIVWHAPGFAPLGTDTFLVRDGRIVTQTFAMQPA